MIWNWKAAATGAGVVLSACTMAAAQPSTAPAEGATVRFEKHRLGNFRSEALGVADFDGDGRLDVVAGPYLYLGPAPSRGTDSDALPGGDAAPQVRGDWKAVQIRTLPGSVDEEGIGYHDDFMNLPLDVDGDGRLDVVTCGWFSKSVSWYRNTLGQEGEWPLMQEEKDVNYEAGQLWDIDGDGKANEILAASADTQWFEVGKLADGRPGLIRHVVSGRTLDYGGGVGDINGDGRPDILRPSAWYEGPADPRKDEWVEHSWGDIALGGPDGGADHTPEILVMDVDGDGLNDVVTSSAHNHGIFWYQQVRASGQTTWKQHLIDDTWSQAHSLALADLDGDGAPELITGKRFMAHNGKDPDAFGPLGVYYYRLSHRPSPEWTRHAISFDEGIGSGVNLCAVDLDEDGDIDVVVTGKWGGPVWFENKGDGRRR